MSTTYTTLSGHTIEYDAPADVVSFVARLQKLAAGDATEDQLIALVYCLDNPLMDKAAIPGRGAVTQRVLDDPAYRVMTDILFRKHVAENGIDVGQLAVAYTLTASEAAERLGVSRSAVHQAIDAGRLAAWVKDGRPYINPASLATFKLSPRGPKSKVPRASTEPLNVHAGSFDGKSLHVKHAGHGELSPARTPRSGEIGQTALVAPWRRVGVITSAGTRARFTVLEPADEENAITYGAFSVRGKFRIVETVNNAKEAGEAFKVFEPA